MAIISRSIIFADGTTPRWGQVENELSIIVDTFNNHDQGAMAWNNIILKASDNRYWKISIGYLEDGITPTMVYQEVTYP